MSEAEVDVTAEWEMEVAGEEGTAAVEESDVANQILGR